jgi:predicted esterase
MLLFLPLLIAVLSNIPSLEDTMTIPEWYTLGPFSVGVREGVIAAEDRIESEGYEPDLGKVYPSWLAQGGTVRWEKIKSDSGRVSIEYKNVAWDTIQDIYGNVGVLCAGYAWASFECAAAQRALVWSPGVSSFTLNGRSYPADAYGDGYFLIPVILKQGKNRLLLKFSGYGDHAGDFKILTAPDPLFIVKEDVLLPDLVPGDTGSAWTAVPVMNASEKRLNDIAIEVTGDAIAPGRAVIKNLIPLACRKVPVRVALNKEFTAGDSTPVFISLSCGDFTRSETCWMKIKKPGEPFCRTFISGIDGSCQYYAVRAPLNFRPDTSYALLLTLHGAGVEARGQAAAYTSKDWAFVVAPTNRRRYGFDWQDWGRLDALEVLAEAKKNFRIDENRVYLVGHSMGGHGTWHVGLTHPDLFAAIAPSAGWTTIQLYAPFFLQKSYLFAEPDQIKYRDMVMREDVAPLSLENARNLPVYILHGGADDNVPPIQGRLMSKYLNDLGYEYVYDEVPGQGHWWDLDSTPGVDCIDKKEMMDFLRNEVRDPYPSKVVFKTTDLAHTNQCYWVRIDELENLYEDGEINIEAGGIIDQSKDISDLFIWLQREYKIKTKNIKGFSLFLYSKVYSDCVGRMLVNIKTKEYKSILNKCKIRFNINNQGSDTLKMVNYLYNENTTNTWVSFYKSGNKFIIGKSKEKGVYKSPEFYGPIKRAYFSPFLLVYGTKGDSLSNERNLHQARLQSYTWWMRANGLVEVVPDTEVTEEMAEKYNLILFGNNETNAYVKQINYKLPIRMEYGHIFIGEEKIEGDSLCLMEIYPNPHCRDRFVLLYSATNQAMERFCGLFSTLYSSAGLPDFLVWDRTALDFGWAGLVCAGFFDQHWRLDKNYIYLKK